LLDEGRATTVRDAERRFPVRIKIAVPREGLGSRLDHIIAWLDANCGADGWISTPSSTRGVVNDALAVYFADATIAVCICGLLVRRTEGRDRGSGVSVRDDEPTPRIGSALHRTPNISPGGDAGVKIAYYPPPYPN